MNKMIAVFLLLSLLSLSQAAPSPNTYINIFTASDPQHFAFGATRKSIGDGCDNGQIPPYCCANGSISPYCCANNSLSPYCCANGSMKPDCS
jgi:hypothetical protein